MATRGLVLVSGATCTGKTAVSAALARELGCPAVRKDDIKERLCEVLGCPDIEASRRIGGAAWETLYLVLELVVAHTPLALAEGNFYGRARDQVAEIAQRHGCTTVEVLCTTERRVWARRIMQRARSPERHSAHFDAQRLADAREEDLRPGVDAQPMNLGGALVVLDTTDFGGFDPVALATRVRAELSRTGSA